MAESTFSWFKLASFVIACLLVLTAFIAVASGISLICDNKAVNGVFTIISGFVCAYNSYLVYKNYQNKRK